MIVGLIGAYFARSPEKAEVEARPIFEKAAAGPFKVGSGANEISHSR